MIIFESFAKACIPHSPFGKKRQRHMIDIDKTLLIQIINFLVLLIALNFLLFKPIGRNMREREQGISSAFGDAKAAQERMQNIQERYNASLADAKQKAVATYNATYQEGLDAQRDMISSERAQGGRTA